ncbi:MAG: FAD/NAD(P)-binding protein [Oligoflexia bacterium]|nr:FAD/NAD(P)-binding protein [Oligoflexia bacterium]
MCTNNIYYPYQMKLTEIRDETHDIRTFKLEHVDPKLKESFTFLAGQFGLYSILGEGEATFCIASAPTKQGYIECSFKKVGKVTTALRSLEVGDLVGFRGPYGNAFPIEQMLRKNILFVGGGIGLAPLRSLIDNVLDRRAEFKGVTILYGARSTADIIYREQLATWEARSDVRFEKTVDQLGPQDEGKWSGHVGLIPHILSKMSVSAENSVAVVCGPPIMIKFTIAELNRLGFNDSSIITTLENRMKCGFGKCGRCNIGGTYVCKDGPVFSASDLKGLPDSDF